MLGLEMEHNYMYLIKFILIAQAGSCYLCIILVRFPQSVYQFRRQSQTMSFIETGYFYLT